MRDRPRMARWAAWLAAFLLFPAAHAVADPIDKPGAKAAKPDTAKPASSPPKRAEFKMEKVDILDSKVNEEPERYRLVFRLAQSGQRAFCSRTPAKSGPKYPKLKSAEPWYGRVRFSSKPRDKTAGRELHFVVDESKGTGKGHDRLYADLNFDGDLTNDRVVMPMKKLPSQLAPRWQPKQRVFFDAIDIPFDMGDGQETRPVRVLPRFEEDEYEKKRYAGVAFVQTVVRQGQITIGTRRYTACLGSQYLVQPRFDREFTTLCLMPLAQTSNEYWWGHDRLRALRLVDGRRYTISASPEGDTLVVTRYDGPLGILKMGPGGRKLRKMTLRGSLESKDLAVPIGAPKKDGLLPELRKCELPEGDYKPNLVSVRFGTLRISLSPNYHSDGLPRDRHGRPDVYGIKIRKGKPFVFDFSNKPDVLFASPAKDKTYAPGDEINVQAVLIDPVLDLMIRDLDDMSKMETKKIKMGKDQTTEIRQPKSLDPVVVITDSNGKTVNEGKMPFG